MDQRQFAKSLWALISRYWTRGEKKTAWGMLLAIVALTISAVYMTLLLNDWFNAFYSALQDYDTEGVYHQLIRFTYLAFAHIALSVYAFYLQRRLSLSWRRWLTEEYLSRWTGNRMYYRMEMAQEGHADNPDQRISEDIQLFTSQTLSFMNGLLRAVTTIVCFIAVLWNLSEPLNFSVAGYAFHISGYLVWAALIYSAAGTWITHTVGKRLVSLNFAQQKKEADFRFGMIRLREGAESVAFYEGATRERSILSDRLSSVLSNMLFIIKKEKQLSWLTNSYAQIAIIFPFVVAVPKYLTRHISLGGLMQVANCFGKVQESMSYFVDVYASLAEWQSCARRLLTFDAHMNDLMAEAAVHDRKVKRAKGNGIVLSHVTVSLPGGDPLLEDVTLSIAPGEKIILKGPSGSGKSTLLRVFAGLWPYAEGALTLPGQALSMTIPQRPYLPMGTLREAAAYPDKTMSDEALIPLMRECGLARFIKDLDRQADWSHILSLGEMQKLAFLRIFHKQPAFVFLDEATSAMDEDREAAMYKRLCAIPNVTVVSIGHRSTLDQWHTRILSIDHHQIIG